MEVFAAVSHAFYCSINLLKVDFASAPLEDYSLDGNREGRVLTGDIVSQLCSLLSQVKFIYNSL